MTVPAEKLPGRRAYSQPFSHIGVLVEPRGSTTQTVREAFRIAGWCCPKRLGVVRSRGRLIIVSVF